MSVQFQKEVEEKRKRNYRTASGDENCSNCEFAATLSSKLRCALSPDVQFLAASYMRCDAHAYEKGENPCKVSTKPGSLRM